MNGKEKRVMDSLPKISLQRLFEDMDDPRVVGRCTYPLTEVVLIGICGVLCGAESWTEIEEFGKVSRRGCRSFCAWNREYPRIIHFGGYSASCPPKVLKAAFANGSKRPLG